MKSSDSFFGCAPEGTHVVEGRVELRETSVRGQLRMLYADPRVEPRGAVLGVGQTGLGRDASCDGLLGVDGHDDSLICRLDERRVGTACCSTCRSRWSRDT